jgi:glycosyltransferase involved in cell wall biosynthesis
MGMGVPVLHGVAGESAEIVRAEDVGQVFEPDNAVALADALLALRADPARLQHYRERGIAAARHYDRQALAARMLQVLRATLSRR